jgi:hypothetical protein
VLEAQMHSQLAQPANSVTLMLTATADRLQRLEALCRSWPFPIMVAAYVPLLDSWGPDAAAAVVANATAALRATFDRWVAPRRSTLTSLLWWSTTLRRVAHGHTASKWNASSGRAPWSCGLLCNATKQLQWHLALPASRRSWLAASKGAAITA